jgi:hypothetical protein
LTHEVNVINCFFVTNVEAHNKLERLFFDTLTSWKGLPGANTLAYVVSSSATKKKLFYNFLTRMKFETNILIKNMTVQHFQTFFFVIFALTK